jgi:hypothetical protein
MRGGRPPRWRLPQSTTSQERDSEGDQLRHAPRRVADSVDTLPSGLVTRVNNKEEPIPIVPGRLLGVGNVNNDLKGNLIAAGRSRG